MRLGNARLHQVGGFTVTGKPVVCSTVAKTESRVTTGKWIHHFRSADQGCRDVIRFIGVRIGGHRAGRHPAAILFREGGDDDTQSLHTDYHFHSVRWEDPNSNPDAGEATHLDGHTR